MEFKKKILRKTDKAMVKAICDRKVVVKKTTEKRMDMLGLKETVDGLATAKGLRWY